MYNVLAIKTQEYAGFNPYLDCGLSAYSVYDGSFGYNSRYSWSGSFDISEGWSNCFAYEIRNDVSCSQSLSVSTGLYRLTASACEGRYYDNENSAAVHKYDNIPTVIYLNNAEQNIPSVFCDAPDIQFEDCFFIDGKYVPKTPYVVPRLFDEGRYKCDVWAFYDSNESEKLEIGIRSNANDNNTRWTCWDNFDIIYYSESEVNQMLESLKTSYSDINKRPQNKNILEKSKLLLTDVDKASTYKEKGLASAP